MKDNNNLHPVNRESGGLKKAIMVTLLIVLILVVGFHLILPLLGITIALTAGVLAGAWTIGVALIALLCIGIVLFFILPWVLVLAFSAIAFVGVILAIVLFPILFPLLIPLLVVLLFIAYIRRRKNP